MKVKKNLKFKVLSSLLAFFTTATMVLSFPLPVSASNGDTGSADLQVDYHTKAEIANYIKNHPDSDAYQVNYDANPVITPPYALGKISDSSLNGTITLFNTFRYIAGIPANVTLNDEYNELAQSAALVNAANNQMSHYPAQPSGMSDEMYQKGKKGAGSSNIGWGYRSLGSALKTGWMSDADSKNIDRIGHRRWVLNPSMDQTGFGYAGSHSAMYAFDSSNSEGKNYKGVAWPAQNTPIGYFPSNDPWSISLGEEVISATVTLTCVNTCQQWVFGGEPNCKINNDTGYFNINNDGYGQKGCIVFRPNGGTSVQKDYSYNVSVSARIAEYGEIITKNGNWTYYTTGKVGEKDINLNYTVDFFDIEDYAGQSTNNNNENPDNPSNNNQNNSANEEQVKEFVKRFYVTILERPYDEDGLNNWAAVLLNKQRTATDVAHGFVFSDEFMDKGYSNEEFVKRLYSAFFNRESANDPDGASLWVNALKDGKSREYVFAGFVNSDEFRNLCASYGIDAGGEYVPNDNNSGKQPTQQQNPQPSKTQSGITIDASGVDPAKLDEFMERLYNEALGRPSDPQGKQDWANAILSGQYDAGTVARYGFFASDEYLNKNKTPEEFVHDAYRAFFGRDEDAAGYDMWVKAIKDGTYTRDQVIEAGFGYSDEFIGLLESYGFKVYR